MTHSKTVIKKIAIECVTDNNNNVVISIKTKALDIYVRVVHAQRSQEP